MPERPLPDKFLVAFSFAGEQRDLVRSVAEELEKRFGPGRVFLDEWYEHYIAGDSADLVLQDIYQRSELVVFCISKPYGNKPWTRVEFESIRALKMRLSLSTAKSDRLRILPLRVGDGDVEGILFNTICPDAREKPAGQTAELIINRLRLIRPDLDTVSASREALGGRHRVYLAECTPDLEDLDKPISRQRIKAFLNELGYEVLPTTEYPAEQYPILLEQDLKECFAFVQLIGPYPWKRGGFDRIQNEAAATLAIPRFRYRSAEIDLEKVEPSQREFLIAPDVIASGFEDFKGYLAKKLTVLAPQPPRITSDAPAVYGQSGTKRRLRLFLCHSSADKASVRALCTRLSNDGVDPWLDEEDLLPGQRWQEEIPLAVKRSDVVLVCMSRDSINKAGYVQKEIRFALDVAQEQPEGTIFLIPARLEKCELPNRLRDYQWVNLYEERGYERLIRALKTRASALGVLSELTGDT